MITPPSLLVLSSEEGSRSAMAAAWLVHYGGSSLLATCATLGEPNVHPLALEAMYDAGVPMTSHQTLNLLQVGGQEFTYVITLCARSRERSPYLVKGQHFVHQSFINPLEDRPNPAQAKALFRELRDELRDFCQLFLGERLGLLVF